MLRGDSLNLSGTTAVVGIIGHPVAHSLSPAIHNAAFAALGLDWVYVPLPVAPDGGGRRAGGSAGPRAARRQRHRPPQGGRRPVPGPPRRRRGGCWRRSTPSPWWTASSWGTTPTWRACAPPCSRRVRRVAARRAGARPGRRRRGPRGRPGPRAHGRCVSRSSTARRRRPSASRRWSPPPSPARPVAWLPLERLDERLVAAQVLVVNATTLGMGGAGKVPAALADTLTARHVAFDVVYAPGGTRLPGAGPGARGNRHRRARDAPVPGGGRVRGLDRASGSAGRHARSRMKDEETKGRTATGPLLAPDDGGSIAGTVHDSIGGGA